MEMDFVQDTYKDRVNWWNSSRFKLNKGLCYSGVVVIVVSGIIFEFLIEHSSDNPRFSLAYFLISTMLCIFYFGLINMVFMLIEILDRTYSLDCDLKIRNAWFNVFFWVALTVPFICPIFLLTMVFLFID